MVFFLFWLYSRVLRFGLWSELPFSSLRSRHILCFWHTHTHAHTTSTVWLHSYRIHSNTHIHTWILTRTEKRTPKHVRSQKAVLRERVRNRHREWRQSERITVREGDILRAREWVWARERSWRWRCCFLAHSFVKLFVYLLYVFYSDFLASFIAHIVVVVVVVVIFAIRLSSLCFSQLLRILFWLSSGAASREILIGQANGA